MKKFLGFILLFFTVSTTFSQAPDHTPMMNKYWDLLSTRTIKKGPSGMYEPFYPPALMAMNKKAITLTGYMVPLKTGAVHKTFLISVLPIAQCQFCGEGDIPEMVEVFMEEPLKFTSKPIAIDGILNISENQDGAAFQLLKGKLRK